MGVLSWIVLGLVAGAIAKFIMPGNDPGGILVTMLLGIVGAVVGGFVGTALGFGTISGFDVRSLLLAIGGTLFFLIVYRFTARRGVT
jgi:uncharacterized membrane protein YeaQ/YmgE (transglycosylase-associated protein family)